MGRRSWQPASPWRVLTVGFGLTVALTVSLTVVTTSCRPSSAPPSLVVISLDTVRRDHLTSYGYARDTMPRLDALARRSAVFDNAYAQDTNTNPSHASMFTGVYPHVHGSRYDGQCLNERELTLAEILEQSGYATGAFVSGSTMTAHASCLDQGFARYDDNFEGHRRDGWTTTDLALEWLDERRTSEPYFLFLHLYDAHGPYLPPGNYSKLFASHEPGPPVNPPNYQTVSGPGQLPDAGLNGYVDRYDGMLRFMDDALDVLLESIDLERTVVVVLADHGETLGERHRQLDHGGQVFDEQIGIPLVIHAPDIEHRRIGAAVETLDLLPTVLDLLGIPLPEDRPVQGRSLAPLLTGIDQPWRESAFASARAEDDRHADRGYRMDPARRIHAVRSSRWKLIRYPGLERDYVELYDLRGDPGERENLAERFPEEVAGRLRLLEDWLGADGDLATAVELDDELREKLSALGYVN